MTRPSAVLVKSAILVLLCIFSHVNIVYAVLHTDLPVLMALRATGSRAASGLHHLARKVPNGFAEKASHGAESIRQRLALQTCKGRIDIQRALCTALQRMKQVRADAAEFIRIREQGFTNVISKAGVLALPIDGIFDWGQLPQKSVDDFIGTGKTLLGVGVFAVASTHFARRWVALEGTAKLRSRLGLYLTIPVIAGLLNWATNKLAVWMIFNPLEFRGIPYISRPRPNEPLGWFGWQGIVPAKVEQMGADIIDLVLDLVDVSAIFKRLDGRVIAEQMAEGGALVRAIANAGESTGVLPAFIVEEAKRKAEGKGSIVGDTMERKAKKIVRRVVKVMSEDPLKYCSVRSSVIQRMKENKRLVCDLFQRCGRDELRFIVDVGLLGGGALGLIQMGLWVVWDPKWSLALGGALVGYATNWIALKVMFEPVEPWRGPSWLQNAHQTVFGKEWPGFQGLFLTRQEEVSVEFAEFVVSDLLAPKHIWDAVLRSPLEVAQDTIKERALVLYEKEQARERERRRREEDDLSAWGARFGDDADPEGIFGTKGNGNSGTDSTERSERDSAAVIKAREEAEARKLKVFEESESEVRAMESLLADCIMKEAWPVVKGGHDGAKRLARELRMELRSVVPATYPYMDKTLDFQPDLYRAMALLPSSRFERLLHPIFEEDELTLILVGGVLGGIAGYGQTFFY